ncbi:hypothetical protein PGT21_030705 [Puccinia graminis f. sp. tritici]|uniref:Uncharacterized protein n=1 Tax=Puccinia graminis f. sp. tritici TaxID=56615 RepID=A0A5B0LZZ9_PUCGR|nr:hypothetical protein PGT21_030705 [Puccinia graminis f. sp. tritici]KAA1112198.1 hypothetical protein PGTUg99_010571 [Puccinia graminis f. sp. tritici]
MIRVCEKSTSTIYGRKQSDRSLITVHAGSNFTLTKKEIGAVWLEPTDEAG